MATGVLPILLGCATKAQSLLPDTDKEYVAAFTLGVATDTLDITGKVLKRCESHIGTEQLRAVLPQFCGDIMQIPPMYSAVSKDGVRLYELARKGIETEREARKVSVSRLELLCFDETTQSGELAIACSKGTYVRVICDDIGKVFGCGCVMTSLRRTRACGYDLSDAVSLDELKKAAADNDFQQYIRPTDTVFGAYPSVRITAAQTVRFGNGGGLMLSRLKITDQAVDGMLYRVYGENNVFMGLGIINTEKNELSVRKRFVAES